MKLLRAQVIAGQATSSKERLGREYTIEGLSALITYESDVLRVLTMLANGDDPTSLAVVNGAAKEHDDEGRSRSFLQRALHALGA
jgi:hypothetical protein